jgi:cyclic pyranopterin monophosphate synthase
MSQSQDFTHIDSQGQLRMVDVSGKEATPREARAESVVSLGAETLRRIVEGAMPKGNVFEAARLAGIMGAKRTWELIPLCHQIQLTGIEVDFFPDLEKSEIRITSRVRTLDRTGVEMEALLAVSHAALTIYDMCKAVDRAMAIRDTRLTFKSGGASGTFQGQ